MNFSDAMRKLTIKLSCYPVEKARPVNFGYYEFGMSPGEMHTPYLTQDTDLMLLVETRLRLN